MARTARARPYVVRAASAVITFWVGVVVLAAVVIAPAVSGQWRLFWFVTGPALLLAWILWVVLYRPAVRYDDAGAVVTNVGRVHVLPWSRVAGVRQGINLVFELDEGKPVGAVGAPAPKRTGNLAGNFDRRTRPVETFHREAELLDGVRKAAAPSPDPVVHRWDVTPLVIGAVLVLAVVVEFAVQV